MLGLAPGRVACLHPGGPWQRGWDEVREGWEAIMANTGYIQFEIADAAVSLVDPVAWVTCTERITSAGAGGAPRPPRSRYQPVRARRLRLAHRAAPRLAGHPARPGRAVIALLLLLRRLPAFAALAAGALSGAILAIVGCVIAAAAGSSPSPRRRPRDRHRRPGGRRCARYLIWRVSWLGLAAGRGPAPRPRRRAAPAAPPRPLLAR